MAIRRNFPVLGNARYLCEMIRPEIRQYFIEGDRDEEPFSRERRAIERDDHRASFTALARSHHRATYHRIGLSCGAERRTARRRRGGRGARARGRSVAAALESRSVKSIVVPIPYSDRAHR